MDGGKDLFDWLHELGYSWAEWVWSTYTYMDLVRAVRG